MLGFAVVLLRLFALVSLKLSEKILYAISHSIHSLFRFGVVRTASFLSTIHWIVTECGSTQSKNNYLKLGIVVPTRFPIAECASVRERSVDQLHVSLKNPSLFERVLAETTVDCLVSWISNGIHAAKLSYSMDPSLLVVYKKNYTSAYSLSGWFNILPRHLVGKKKHEEMRHKRGHTFTNLTSRIAEITSLARENATRSRVWQDPNLFCVNKRIFMRRKPTASTNVFPEYTSLRKIQYLEKVEYLTVEGSGHSQLLVIALRAAQRAESDYIIVVNPRALGLTSDLLNCTLELLQNHSIDIVMGISKSCKLVCSIQSSGSHQDWHEPHGMYLLGLRSGRRLTCCTKALASNVNWSSSATDTQFWNNINRTSAVNWNVACLRERLEEIMEPADLLTLESHIGLPADHLFKDSVSLIIPIGPGHPEDGLDPNEHEEYVSLHSSKNLRTTLELAVHNASGSREIQIIIISSAPLTGSANSSQSLSPNQGDERFLGVCLRPMINVSIHQYDPSKTDSRISDARYPKRGELIHYACEHLATGSMLVFADPGVQLPFNWDSAVYHTLLRPGVGMGCFAYRLQLQDKYVYRKSLTWAINAYMANFLVELQAHGCEIPFAGQPHFIYAHYLACIGGYPCSSRLLHAIDLALSCHQGLGTVALTRGRSCAAGVPPEFALRHGALRTCLYITLIGAARYLGATESELNQALLSDWQPCQPGPGNARPYRLPVIQPHYLDGY